MRNKSLNHNTQTLQWRDYYELTKPRVVMMMLLTAMIGMLLASQAVPWHAIFYGSIGIGFAGGSAAVINQLVDRHIDAKMARTQNRPLPSGKVSLRNAIIFAFALGVIGLLTLVFFVNTLTAALTFATLLGYALIYTVFLKRATPQNIVIGGLAGAMPPMLGWTAVTGDISPFSLLLVLLIFAWTPPHFWALAIARFEEYAKADIPMLPVTHGIPFTILCILLYTLLMIGVSLLPVAIGMSGMIYLFGSSILNAIFLWKTIKLAKTHCRKVAMNIFHYSIGYLMAMFVLLLLDHYVIIGNI